MDKEFDLSQFDVTMDVEEAGISNKRDVMAVNPTLVSKGILADFKETDINTQLKEVAGGIFSGLSSMLPDNELLSPLSTIDKTIKDVTKSIGAEVTNVYSEARELTGKNIPLLDKLEAMVNGSAGGQPAELAEDGNSVAEGMLSRNSEQFLTVSAAVKQANNSKTTLEVAKASLQLNKYSQAVTESFYRKSIEIQFNHLIESKKHTALLSTLLDTNQNNLKVIGHNTSLPDSLKIRGTEALALQARQEFFKSQLYRPFQENGWGTNAIKNTKRIGTNISEFAASKLGGLAEMLGTASSAKSSMEMLNDPDMLEMTGKTKGESLGGVVTGIGRGLIGKGLGKTIGRTRLGRHLMNNVTEASVDYQRYFTDMAENEEEGWKGKLKNLFGKGMSTLGRGDIDNENAELAISKIKDPFAHAELNNRTLESINTVIPSLLGKILVQVTKSASGRDTEELKWNALTGNFTTKSSFQRSFSETLDSRVKTSGMDGKLAGFINTLQSLSGVALTPKEIKQLSTRIMKFRSNRDPAKRLTFMNLRESEFYKGATPKIKKLLWQSIADTRTGLIKYDVSKRLQEALREIGIEEGVHTINALSQLGFTNELTTANQIIKNGDGTFNLHNDGNSIRSSMKAAIRKAGATRANKNSITDDGMDMDMLDRNYDNAVQAINESAGGVFKDLLEEAFGTDIGKIPKYEIRGIYNGVADKLIKHNWSKYDLTTKERKQLKQEKAKQRSMKNPNFYLKLAEKYNPKLLKKTFGTFSINLVKYKLIKLTEKRIGFNGLMPYLHTPNRTRSARALGEAVGFNVGVAGNDNYEHDLSTDSNLMRDEQGRVIRNGERYNDNINSVLIQLRKIRDNPNLSSVKKNKQINKILSELDDFTRVDVIDRLRSNRKHSANKSNTSSSSSNSSNSNGSTGGSTGTGGTSSGPSNPNEYYSGNFKQTYKDLVRKFNVFEFLNLPKGIRNKILVKLEQDKMVDKRMLARFKQALNDYDRVQNTIKSKKARMKAVEKIYKKFSALSGKDLRKFTEEEFFKEASPEVQKDLMESLGYSDAGDKGLEFGDNLSYLKRNLKRRFGLTMGTLTYDDYMKEKHSDNIAKGSNMRPELASHDISINNLTGNLDGRTLLGKGIDTIRNASPIEAYSKFMVNRRNGKSTSLHEMLGMNDTINNKIRDHLNINGHLKTLKVYDKTKELLSKGYNKAKKFISPYVRQLIKSAKQFIDRTDILTSLDSLKKMSLKTPDLAERIILEAMAAGMITLVIGVKLGKMLDKYRASKLTEEEMITPSEGLGEESVRGPDEISKNINRDGKSSGGRKGKRRNRTNRKLSKYDEAVKTSLGEDSSDMSSSKTGSVDEIAYAKRTVSANSANKETVEQYKRYYGSVKMVKTREEAMLRVLNLLGTGKINKETYNLLAKDIEYASDHEGKLRRNSWKDMLKNPAEVQLNSNRAWLDLLKGTHRDPNGPTRLQSFMSKMKTTGKILGIGGAIGGLGYGVNKLFDTFNNPDEEHAKTRTGIASTISNGLHSIPLAGDWLGNKFDTSKYGNVDYDKLAGNNVKLLEEWNKFSKGLIKFLRLNDKNGESGLVLSDGTLRSEVFSYWTRKAKPLWFEGKQLEAIRLLLTASIDYYRDRRSSSLSSKYKYIMEEFEAPGSNAYMENKCTFMPIILASKDKSSAARFVGTVVDFRQSNIDKLSNGEFSMDNLFGAAEDMINGKGKKVAYDNYKLAIPNQDTRSLEDKTKDTLNNTLTSVKDSDFAKYSSKILNGEKSVSDVAIDATGAVVKGAITSIPSTLSGLAGMVSSSTSSMGKVIGIGEGEAEPEDYGKAALGAGAGIMLYKMVSNIYKVAKGIKWATTGIYKAVKALAQKGGLFLDDDGKKQHRKNKRKNRVKNGRRVQKAKGVFGKLKGYAGIAAGLAMDGYDSFFGDDEDDYDEKKQQKENEKKLAKTKVEAKIKTAKIKTATKGFFGKMSNFIGKSGSLLGKGMSKLIPGAGAVTHFMDTVGSIKKGNYGTAALDAIMAIASVVPVTATITAVASGAMMIYDTVSSTEESSSEANKSISKTVAEASNAMKAATSAVGVSVGAVTDKLAVDTAKTIAETKGMHSEGNFTAKLNGHLDKLGVTVHSVNPNEATSSTWNGNDTAFIDKDKRVTKSVWKGANVKFDNLTIAKVTDTAFTGGVNSPKVNKADKFLLEAISSKESKTGAAGYEVLYGYGKYNGKYGKSLKITSKTITQIYEIQETLVNESRKAKRSDPKVVVSSAIGKYQFVRKTLRDVVNGSGIALTSLFSPATQDALIIYRLMRYRGYRKWLAGKLSTDRFIFNLSCEFASIEDRTPAAKGFGKWKSHYINQTAHNSHDHMVKVLEKVRGMYNDKTANESFNYDDIAKEVDSFNASEVNSMYEENASANTTADSPISKSLSGLNLNDKEKGLMGNVTGVLDKIFGNTKPLGEAITDGLNSVTKGFDDIPKTLSDATDTVKTKAEAIAEKTSVATADLLSAVKTQTAQNEKLLNHIVGQKDKEVVVNVPAPQVHVQQVEAAKPLVPIKNMSRY